MFGIAFKVTKAEFGIVMLWDELFFIVLWAELLLNVLSAIVKPR